jgi:hypothetical protein
MDEWFIVNHIDGTAGGRRLPRTPLDAGGRLAVICAGTRPRPRRGSPARRSTPPLTSAPGREHRLRAARYDRPPMAVITIRIEKVPLGVISAQDVARAVAPPEPCRLLLYQAKISAPLLFVRLVTKVIGEFQAASTGEPIPRRRCTPQMIAFCDDQRAQVTPTRGWFKLGILAYVILLALAFGVVDCVGVVRGGLRHKAAHELLMAPAQAGDLYFGRFNETTQAPAGRGGCAWALVRSAHDDHVVLSLASQPDATCQSTSPATAFEDRTFDLVRDGDTKAYQLTLRAPGRELVFWAQDRRPK